MTVVTYDTEQKIRKIKDLIIRNSCYNTFDTELIKLSFSQEFEPHGRASETWEDVWHLELPTIPSYWISSDGNLNQRNPKFHTKIKDKTLDDVLDEAELLMEKIERKYINE